ncbi:DUF7504 family protein, partial [Haladaptatus pallidirubidus]
PGPSNIEIFDYQTAVRSTAAPTSSPQEKVQITPISGTLTDLQNTLIQSVAMQDDLIRDNRSTDIQVYVDSLQPVIEATSIDIGSFLTPIGRAIRGVEGLGYYTLPHDRDSLAVHEIEPIFDAVIELRVSERGPKQRWILPQTGYTTEWFTIIERR